MGRNNLNDLVNIHRSTFRIYSIGPPGMFLLWRGEDHASLSLENLLNLAK